MESHPNHSSGMDQETNGEEPMEETPSPDCFPWPQDDIPDAKPDETLAAIDILWEKNSQPPPHPP